MAIRSPHKTKEASKKFKASSGPVGGGFMFTGRAIGRVGGKATASQISKMVKSGGKSFGEQKYKSSVRVLVKQKVLKQSPSGKVVEGYQRFRSEVKGLNPTHAMQRAESNWPGSQISVLRSIVTKKPKLTK